MNNGLSVVAACWIVFLVYWFISSFFAKKSVTKRNFRWKWIVAIILFAIIINSGVRLFSISFSPIFSQLFFPSYTVEFIGSFFAVVGVIGAVWARTTLGRNWSGYVTYKKDHELVTNGPYRWVRHPIYSSLLLMLIGTFIYDPTLVVIIIFPVYFGIFFWRIRKEEEIMINLFGNKYRNYMKRTKRLIPFVW